MFGSLPSPQRVTGRRPAVQPLWSSDLQFSPRSYPTGWNTALSRPPRIELLTPRLDVATPQVLTLAERPFQVTVRSYHFADVPENPLLANSPASPPSSHSPHLPRDRPPSSKRTWLQPPKDIIK